LLKYLDGKPHKKTMLYSTPPDFSQLLAGFFFEKTRNLDFSLIPIFAVRCDF